MQFWTVNTSLYSYIAEILKFYAPAAKITFIALAGIYIHAVPVVETGRIKKLVDASKKVSLTDCFT